MRTISLALCAVLCGGAVASEATYPIKPVRWVVPYSAGGPTETIARLVSHQLSQAWGQQLIVDLRPGANSIIGTEIVARAQPDGYTMLLALPAFVINPYVYRKLTYSIRDFVAITNIASASYLMLVHPAVNARNPQELVALAKETPGKLNFGSGGAASPAHLAMELFMDRARISMTHVPYKGGAPALTDLIGGQIQILVNPALSAAAHVRSGRLRAIAVTGKERSNIFPELPTVAEGGFKGYEVSTWYGLFAPAKTPASVVEKVAKDVQTALNDPEVRDSIVKLDAKPLATSPAQFNAFVRSEEQTWKPIVENTRISLDR